jgi:hypothetical protein
MAALPRPDFAAPGFTGLDAAPAPAPVSTVTGSAAGSESCDLVFATLLEDDVASRGWRLSVAVDVPSERGCGASRSLLAGSAALLSINDEKLSGAGTGSALADRDGAVCRDRFAAVSDVTLNTSGLSRMIPVSDQQGPGHGARENKFTRIQ